MYKAKYPLSPKSPTLKVSNYEEYKTIYSVNLNNIGVNKFIDLQKQRFKEMKKNTNPLVKKFNKDFIINNESQDVQQFNNNILNAIENIEKNINLKKESSLGIDMNDVKKVEQMYLLLIENWKNIYNNIKKYDTAKTVEDALKKLNANTIYVENNLNAIIKKGGLETETVIKKGEEIGFLQQMMGIANALKGLELEVQGTNFLMEHLPEDKSLKVYNTGNIYYEIPVIGSKKLNVVSMKPDIFALYEDLEVEYYIKKKGKKRIKKVAKFSELAKDSQEFSVIITKDSYSSLQKKLVLAVTAKAGQSKSTTFQQSTIPALIARSPKRGAQAWNLYHLYQIAKINKNFKPVQHNDYSLLYNYVLSKNITEFIGKENVLYLTRKGFKLTAEYFLEQLELGAYINAGSSIDLTKAATISFTEKTIK